MKLQNKGKRMTEFEFESISFLAILAGVAAAKSVSLFVEAVKLYCEIRDTL